MKIYYHKEDKLFLAWAETKPEAIKILNTFQFPYHPEDIKETQLENAEDLKFLVSLFPDEVKDDRDILIETIWGIIKVNQDFQE